jgi:hypothetical protein
MEVYTMANKAVMPVKDFIHAKHPMEPLMELGWEVIDVLNAEEHRFLIADRFGPGCLIGAFVDDNGMRLFSTDEESTAEYYVDWRDVSTVPSPPVAMALLLCYAM